MFRSRQVSPSISHQTQLRCNRELQDAGCDGGLVKASVRLITAEQWNTKSLLWIQNHTSDTQGFPLEFPPSLSPLTTGLHSASKGDHLSELVNVSWSSLHSSHLVSGEDGCQSVRGCGCCLHLRRAMLCNALPCGHPCPAVCGGSSSRCENVWRLRQGVWWWSVKVFSCV